MKLSAAKKRIAENLFSAKGIKIFGCDNGESNNGSPRRMGIFCF